MTARLRTTRASRILYVDAAGARLLRRDAAMLLDKPLVVFVPMSERPTFRARIALLPPGGFIEGWSLDFATPAGTEIPVIATVEARSDLATNGEDELHWTLSAAAPTDEDEAIDDVLDPSAERIARETAHLMHELKQPLAAIVSYARGAIMRSRNRSLTPADLEGVLEIIATEALRAADKLRRREDESGGES